MLTLNDGRSELWQWDTGRKLTVDADCSQVHFSNKVFGRSIDVDVVDSVAIIPDILLQTDKELTAWAFVGTAENGYTKISKVFKVNKRNKPADYVFTPPEQTTLGELIERLDKIEESQDPDAIKNAVDDYLANNPIEIDETDPTVPEWAKKPTKPGYTALEVGALPADTVIPTIPDNVSAFRNDAGYLTEHQDLTGYATKQWVNDQNYLTEVPDGYAKTDEVDPKGTATSAVSQHNTADDSHNDIRLELKALSDRLTAFFDSDDQTLDELSEIVAYITSNKTLIDSITTSKVSVADIINNLTTNVTNKPLSAAQGVVLKELIDGLSTGKLDASALQSAVDAALAQAKARGEFNGKDGKNGTSATHSWNGTVLTITSASGTSSADLKGDKGEPGDKGDKGDTGATGVPGKDGYTPQKNVDYFDGKDGKDGKDGLDATPVTPLFANSIAECTDTTKFYVLPDGFIYAYLYKEASGPAYTNLAGAVQENTRLGSAGTASALAGAITTGFVPVKQGDKVRIKGMNPTALVSGKYPYICFYTGASETAVVASNIFARGDGDLWSVNGDVYEYDCFEMTDHSQHSLAYTITHIRVNGVMTGTGADVIVTVNEEIVDGSAGGYSWQSTGHAFVPADYENRIIALESHANAVPVSRIKAIEATLKAVQTAKPWTGKKWVVVGDSLTQALNSDGTNANTDKYYHTHIAEETGISIVNMGQGGTGYKKTDDSGYAFYQRIVNVPTDADVITIMGSINDLSRTENYTLGEPTDTGTDTICGCINTTLDNLFSTFPLANVGIITPMPNDYYNYFNFKTDTRTQRITEYCEKLTEICHRRSIPVLDMFHGSGMRPWDANFKAAFMPDGTHANEAGHKIMATKIKAFLESLL